jgi:hypothetical protein
MTTNYDNMSNFDIIANIIDSIFQSLYIGLLAFSYYYLFISPHINEMKDKIKYLEDRQEIIYNAVVRLRNIAVIDTDLRNDETKELSQLKKQVKLHSKHLGLKYEDDTSSETEANEEEEDEETDSTVTQKNQPVLPIQNHITFPDFNILTDYKKILKSLNKKELINSNIDIRLVSNQLAAFLKRPIGTCLEFNDIYDEVLQYINDNDITAINQDANLRKLFGISEDEDYEYSYSELVKVLKNLLEPHLKKISYRN